MSRQTKLPFCKSVASPAKRQRLNSTEPGEDKGLQPSFRSVEPSHSRTPSLTDPGPSPRLYSTARKGDIGANIDRVARLSDADKYALIVDPYVPPTNFNFPKHAEHGKQRSFQHSWLTKYPWLVYSRHLDGGFCLPCALMNRGGAGDRILVEKPMCKFNKASDHLKEHSQKRAHFVAIQDMESFRSVMEQSTLPIHDQLQSAVCLQIKRNRDKLISVLKTVVLCGKQNISFRGHRDDSKYLNEDSQKCGNFQALLDFRIDAGDVILKQHFETAPRNATYRSKTIQNELIDCVATWIRQRLVDEAREARFFSILADETTDCSNREQLTLVLRYVDSQNQICEEFF